MPLSDSITLQPHQQALRDEAVSSLASGQPFRKMLLWQVGSGKSLGALSAADALQAPATVVVPAAVRPSFKAEASRLLDSPPPVVSYHAAATGKAPPHDTLVVDEAQRLNSTGSQATAVSELAQKARNVLLLSGTPIRNHPRELASSVSILSGQHISPEEFEARYVGTERRRPGGLLGWLRGESAVETPVIKHENELRHLLQGKIDYYEDHAPPVGAPSSVKYEDVESEMTPRQTELYKGVFGKLPYVLRWKLRFNYPLSDSELVKARSFLTGPRQIGLSDLPYRPDKNPLKAFENSGKLRKAMDSLRLTMSDPRTKAIAYSNFLNAGLRPYSAALTKLKIPHGIFHGGLSDEERRKLMSDFNEGKIRVALVAPAGAEGISLKGAQKIQLLDQHWNDARMRQAQARGIRFDSHMGLPEDLKGVTVERHIAKLPLGLADRMLSTVGVDRQSQRNAVDDYLMSMSTRKERLNKQFLDVFKDIGAENARRREKGAAEIRPMDLIKAAGEAIDLDRGDAFLMLKVGEMMPGLAGDAVLHGRMRQIKAHSDLGNRDGYAEKTKMLRESIMSDPASWRIDSVLNPEFVGVTHKSGWRFHMRKRDVDGLLPSYNAPIALTQTAEGQPYQIRP